MLSFLSKVHQDSYVLIVIKLLVELFCVKIEQFVCTLIDLVSPSLFELLRKVRVTYLKCLFYRRVQMLTYVLSGHGAAVCRNI